MNYFILINDVQQGPFTIDELRQRGLQQDTLVWAEGMAQWTPAWQVEELKPLLFGQSEQQQPKPVQPSQPTPPPPPPYSGNNISNQNGQQYQSGQVPPQGTGAVPVQNKQKKHKGCWIALIIILVVLFILALSNPGQAEHRKAIIDRIDSSTEQMDNISDPTVRSVMSALTGIGNGVMKEVVRQLIDEDLEYHNYIIFSTTTLHSDLLRHDIRTSTGFLGHVNAVSLSNIMPDIIMRQMGADGIDNGTTESTTTTVDGDGNETTETTKTTRKNGVTVDSLTKRVTNRIADEVANRVKKEVRQEADSSTASGIEAIVNDVLQFIKGL